MYRLYQTDDLAAAAREHRRLLEADPDSPRSLVVIQSAHMQRWLSRELAGSGGIWFQPEFVTPDGGLRRILAEMEGGEGRSRRRALFMDDLKFLCFRQLVRMAGETSFAADQPVLSRLIAADGSPAAFSRRRLYELADSLAGLYYGYSQLLWSADGLAEPDLHLFDLWHRGRLLLDGRGGGSARGALERGLAEHEAWQRDLYLRAFPEGRGYEIGGYQAHCAIREGWSYRGPYRRLVLFGSAFLSSLAFGLFRSLAASGVEVHHVVLTPAPQLAADAGAAALEPGSLLADWAELFLPFRDAARSAGVAVQSSFADRPPAPGDALAALRAALAEPPPSAPTESAAGGEDAPAAAGPSKGWTFRRFDCSSPWREVEALKQNLLALMAELRAEGRTLRPQEIAVMAPDIQVYRPYLESIFPKLGPDGQAAADHLPINVVDLDFGGDSPVMAALDGLLALGDGRLERSAVLELLDNPAIRLAVGLEESEVETVRRWTDCYRVRWGLNAPHRIALRAGRSWSNTWDRALRRLFDDLALGRRRVSSAELAAIGRTADYLHRNHALVAAWQSASKPLAEWVRELQGLIERSIAAPDERQERVLDQIKGAAANLLTFPRQLGLPDDDPSTLDWVGFEILFRDQLAHLSSGRGQHQIDGVTCSSLRPYRAIPFRLVALLGMDEGAFPRADEHFSFDLMRLERRSAGLIGRRSTDLYAWLETMASAREWLWVFHVGRDPAGGEPRNPAPMVRRSLAFLRARGWAESVLDSREPVLDFDPAYFGPGGEARGLRCLDPLRLEAARAWRAAGLERRPPERDPFEPRPDAGWRQFLRGPEGAGLRLDFNELVDFLANPVRAHVRRRWGVRLDREDAESLSDAERVDLPRYVLNAAIRDWEADADAAGRAADILADLAERDELFPTPLADTTAARFADRLRLVQAALAGQTDGIRPAPIAAEHLFRVAAPGLPAGEAATVRLRMDIDRLWRGAGECWQLCISAKDGPGFSNVDNKDYYRLGATLALFASLGPELAALGHRPPAKLAHLALGAPTPGKALGLADIAAERFPLDLETLLEAWVANLARPLPVYIGNLGAVLKKDPAAAIGPDQWAESFAGGGFGPVFGQAAFAADCPYFAFLGGDARLAPAWRPEYGEAIDRVWRPLWALRSGFMRGKK